MPLPLKITVLAGDRSGPFYHTYAVQSRIFQKYGIIEFQAVDYIATDLLKISDIVEFQRQYASESVIMNKILKDKGIPVIMHIDDNVWELPPNNPAKSVYEAGGPVFQRLEMNMRSADWITTSTPYLKKWCLKYNPNVEIYRNVVEMEIESYQSPGRDNPREIRVGWTGTPHHYDDIAPMEGLFPELAKDNRIKLVFMGFAPPNVLREIPRKKWEYYEFVPVDFYYPCYAALDFDIGIAPLEDNGFNKGKTARKAQEYAITNTPMVLAPVMCYGDWTHGDTCLKPKANTPQAWYERIMQIINHPKDTEWMVKKAREQVQRNHDADRWSWERAGQYYKIYKEVKGKDHPYTDVIRRGLEERKIDYAI
jgi:hypothetical protein